MDLDKDKTSCSTKVICYILETTVVKYFIVAFSPAKEGLGEVVLGSILELHPSLQQHLLVKLPLLLLLLQMLLHAKTLPVILLYVLCRASTLDKHTYTINQREKEVFAEDVEISEKLYSEICFT